MENRITGKSYDKDKVNNMFENILETKLCYPEISNILYENGFEHIDDGDYLYQSDSSDSIYLWCLIDKRYKTIEFQIEILNKTISLGKTIFSDIEGIKKYMEYLFVLYIYEIGLN
jgi:hypothetical protein